MVIILDKKKTSLFYFFMLLKIINKFPYRWAIVKKLFEQILLSQINNRIQGNQNITPLYDPILNVAYEPNTEEYSQLNEELQEKIRIREQLMFDIRNSKEQDTRENFQLQLNNIENEITKIEENKNKNIQKMKLNKTDQDEIQKLKYESPMIVDSFSKILIFLKDKKKQDFVNIKSVLESALNFSTLFESRFSKANQSQKQLLIDFILFLANENDIIKNKDTNIIVISTAIDSINEFKSNQNIQLIESYDNKLNTQLRGNKEKSHKNVQGMIKIIKSAFIQYVFERNADPKAYDTSLQSLENMKFIMESWNEL